MLHALLLRPDDRGRACVSRSYSPHTRLTARAGFGSAHCKAPTQSLLASKTRTPRSNAKPLPTWGRRRSCDMPQRRTGGLTERMARISQQIGAREQSQAGNRPVLGGQSGQGREPINETADLPHSRRVGGGFPISLERSPQARWITRTASTTSGSSSTRSAKSASTRTDHVLVVVHARTHHQWSRRMAMRIYGR